MRVISGKYKGRKLQAPKGLLTRPTTDKVKEAIFNTLTPVLSKSNNFLDLFAGSGAIGIEALSRGIEECIFVEKDIKAVKILKKNLEICNSENYRIIKKDAFKAVSDLEKKYFSLIFLDPPYNMENIPELVNKLGVLLVDGGFVVLETAKNNNFEENIQDLSIIKDARYGDTKILYLKNKK